MEQIKGILNAVKRAHEKSHDTVIVIVGSEGMGKSNLALDIIDEWCGMTGQTPFIGMVALDREDWIKSIDSAIPQFGINVFDEAGDGLFSRDAMTEFNKDAAKMLMVIRARGLFSILVLPSFSHIDSFIRKHRIKGLFHVYKRGACAFWDKRRIKQICEIDKDIYAVKPLFFDSFPLYKGILREDYARLKATKVNNMISDMAKKYNRNPIVDTSSLKG
jgi:hypothetical protein